MKRNAIWPVLAALWLAAPAESADLAPGADAGDVVLEDVIEVQVLDREVFAFDALGSGRIRLRLDEDEKVLWTGSRGRVGIAITNRRLLGASPEASFWREADLRLAETVPDQALLGGRVALALTQQRALAFAARTAKWVAAEIGPQEEVLLHRAGESTGLVITPRRALGFSANLGRFFEIKLRIHETIEDVRAGAQVATVTTSQRILVFRSPTGVWGEEKRPINP